MGGTHCRGRDVVVGERIPLVLIQSTEIRGGFAILFEDVSVAVLLLEVDFAGDAGVSSVEPVLDTAYFRHFRNGEVL